MKKDNRKIGEIIDNAKECIAVTSEAVAVKGKKVEIMALVGTLLSKLFEDKIINDKDLDIIIESAKEYIKEKSKEDTEENKRNMEITINLDETARDIVKKLFDFENKD